jgi:hypothetical protein
VNGVGCVPGGPFIVFPDVYQVDIGTELTGADRGYRRATEHET